MRAFEMPPSDPRVSQMNEAQWLWSYLNLKKDQEEDERNWKARLTYLGSYTDFERAKSIAEQDMMEEEDERARISGIRPIRDGIYQNTEFNMEAEAASKGYNPNSGLTPQEFLQQLQNSGEDLDIMNASFDDLIASGQFSVVNDGNSNVGNKSETQNDFLSRVAAFETMTSDKLDIITKPPIGIESDEEINILTNGSKNFIEELLDEDIQIMKKSINPNNNPIYKLNGNKLEIDEDDLDIIITKEDLKDGGGSK